MGDERRRDARSGDFRLLDAEPIDAFAHPFWNTVREHVANKAMEMRRQGFVGAAMLPMPELEYTGITEKLAELDKRFVARALTHAAVA